MAIYEYQGEKFELKDGLSQQEAEVKIKNFLNEEDESKEDKSPGFLKSFFAGIASGALKIPVGTTAQRPSTGVAGMIRYNSTTDSVEYYDVTETQFKSLTAEFTVIAGETFDGDGSEVNFTLGSTQTTASCIVSINGVVQLPTTAYSVSGTTLTFTNSYLK